MHDSFNFIVVLAVLTILTGCLERPSSYNTRDYINSVKRHTIESAILDLLESRIEGQRGGFVIFEGEDDFDFVQYSLEPGGFQLFWPIIHEKGLERLPRIEGYLQEHNFKVISEVQDKQSIASDIADLKEGYFQIAEDGLYAQVGRNPVKIQKLTVGILETILGVEDITEVGITLELIG